MRALLLLSFTVAAGAVAVATIGVQAQTTTPTDPGQAAFQAECGACHMPFQPQFLPARSWELVMANLSKHFKENASLDKPTTELIKNYLVAHSAEATGYRRALQGLNAADTPQRITESAWWVSEHRRVTDAQIAQSNIKSRANCVACHPNARRAAYEPAIVPRPVAP